jgi:riboflavin synthase
MFTGIIAAVGHIKAIEPKNGDWRLTLATGTLDLSDVQLGDSIATNGVCLTAIELGAGFFVADVSAETLGVTTLGAMKVGSRVNLEKALRLADRLGGHLVSGHVDGVGEVLRVAQDARSWRFVIAAPKSIAHYIAHKGSICINGISLTVNHVDGHTFDVNIVPHTMDNTTIADWQVGTQLNLEVDLLARYLERLLQGQKDPATSNITAEFLASNGY